jgi:hypothetical protein
MATPHAPAPYIPYAPPTLAPAPLPTANGPTPATVTVNGVTWAIAQPVQQPHPVWAAIGKLATFLVVLQVLLQLAQQA